VRKEIYSIADDSLVNRMHTIHFSNMGLEKKTMSFTYPEMALDELGKKNGFNGGLLMFPDINIPEMNGFEFL
jgi:two-component SAPR family response regulator